MRAIITGAASGIGKAVAAKLKAGVSASGAPLKMLLVDREEGSLARVAAELDAVSLVVDLAAPDAGEALLARAAYPTLREADASRRAERASHMPLRRVGAPEDIAAVIAFLLGPDAGFITGVDLLVDGGLGTSLLPAVRGLSPP